MNDLKEISLFAETSFLNVSYSLLFNLVSVSIFFIILINFYFGILFLIFGFWGLVIIHKNDPKTLFIFLTTFNSDYYIDSTTYKNIELNIIEEGV